LNKCSKEQEKTKQKTSEWLCYIHLQMPWLLTIDSTIQCFFFNKWSFQKYFPVPYSEMAFWLPRPVSKRKRKNSQWEKKSDKNNLCNCNYFIIFYSILDSL